MRGWIQGKEKKVMLQNIIFGVMLVTAVVIGVVTAVREFGGGK